MEKKETCFGKRVHLTNMGNPHTTPVRPSPVEAAIHAFDREVRIKRTAIEP